MRRRMVCTSVHGSPPASARRPIAPAAAVVKNSRRRILDRSTLISFHMGMLTSTRRNFLATLGAAALARSAPAKKLNFIIVLIDDMGWTDLGSFGSKFYQTPNVDRLAA